MSKFPLSLAGAALGLLMLAPLPAAAHEENPERPGQHRQWHQEAGQRHRQWHQEAGQRHRQWHRQDGEKADPGAHRRLHQRQNRRHQSLHREGRQRHRAWHRRRRGEGGPVGINPRPLGRPHMRPGRSPTTRGLPRPRRGGRR